jgi:RNA polymerase sigma-70 factor (ECF subfamily)
MIQAIERDPGFWQAAYRAHASHVRSFLRRRVRRRDDAEDLLQETFLRAIDSGSYREGNLRGYLFTIARNLLISRLRRPAQGREVDPRVAPAREGTVADGPERQAVREAFHLRLATALGRLDDAHRTAFELGVLEGRPYDEVARETGASRSAVKVRIFRARRRLIEELGDHLRDLRGNSR